jgi:general secretion pathway protein A
LEELEGAAHTAFVCNTIGSPKDLLRYVCEDFGILNYRREQRELHDYLTVLNRFLLESYRKEKNVVLVIDEAQNLSAEVLESIRLLSNFETSRDKLLQIVLVGQPELRDLLDLPQLRQLKQRIGVRCRIRPLTTSEVGVYIRYRLAMAKASDPEIFAAAAVEEIAEYSRGIPRLINVICDHALLIAYADQKRKIGRDVVREATGYLEGKEHRPSPWRSLFHRPQAGYQRWLMAAAAVALLAGAFFASAHLDGPTIASSMLAYGLQLADLLDGIRSWGNL